MSQPPTSKYPDLGEITTLRLELARERDRANALEAALRKEVLAVIRSQFANSEQEKASLKADVDLWKLRSDNWQKLLQVALNESKGFKAEIERLKQLLATSLIIPPGSFVDEKGGAK